MTTIYLFVLLLTIAWTFFIVYAIILLVIPMMQAGLREKVMRITHSPFVNKNKFFKKVWNIPVKEDGN